MNSNWDLIETWIKEYGDKIVQVVTGIVGDEDIAQDITQDVFLKLYRRSEQYRGDSNPYTYIYRVAYNASLDHLRTEKRKKRRIQGNDGEKDEIGITDKSAYAWSDTADPERHLVNKETSLRIRQVIDSLPAKYRVPILFHYISGMEITEISNITDIPEGTVKSRLHRGRKKLKTLITEQGILRS